MSAILRERESGSVPLYPRGLSAHLRLVPHGPSSEVEHPHSSTAYSPHSLNPIAAVFPRAKLTLVTVRPVFWQMTGLTEDRGRIHQQYPSSLLSHALTELELGDYLFLCRRRVAVRAIAWTRSS